jgi:glycosyltransferase involved in cell wall biosynthesis
MLSIAVVILTHNEAHHIERALQSVKPLAREVFIIDSGSTDGTVQLAQALGAHVMHNPWVNYAVQFQYGLDNAPITSDWVMRLDADEILEPDLVDNLLKIVPTLPDEVTGINFDRKHIFMGRFIRHGGRYPLTLLRLWRKGCARIENRWMDEHIVLTHGRTITVPGGFSDVNLGDLTFFTDKHNKYATREAVDVLNQKYDLFPRDLSLSENEDAQAKRKRQIKEGIYNKLPFGLGPSLYFVYRYIFQLGFLDGVEGAIYHFLQGYWYRFLVEAKIVELERAIKGRSDKIEMIEALERSTKLKLR